MIKKWLIKNNNQEVSSKSFCNKIKEFADKIVINYNLDNDNYVGINLIEKDYNQKGNSMTLEKLASMLIEFKIEVNNKIENKFNELNDKVNNLNDKVNSGFKEVNSRIDKLETRMDNLENRMDKLEKDVSILKDDVSLIMSCPTIRGYLNGTINKEVSQWKKENQSQEISLQKNDYIYLIYMKKIFTNLKKNFLF